MLSTSSREEVLVLFGPKVPQLIIKTKFAFRELTGAAITHDLRIKISAALLLSLCTIPVNVPHPRSSINDIIYTGTVLYKYR